MITSTTVLRNNEYTDIVFYIANADSPNEVLFSTMGGFKFDSYKKKDGEWESKYKFNTYEEVLEKILELKERTERTLQDKKFTVLKIVQRTESTSTVIRDSIVDELNDKVSIRQTMESFEKFLAGNTRWSPQALVLLRSTTMDKYDHTSVQAAFEQFCALQSNLPEE